MALAFPQDLVPLAVQLGGHLARCGAIPAALPVAADGEPHAAILKRKGEQRNGDVEVV